MPVNRSLVLPILLFMSHFVRRYRSVCLAAGLLVFSFAAQAQISTVTVPTEVGSGLTRIRKISYTNASLNSGSAGAFYFDAAHAASPACSSTRFRQAKRLVLTAKFNANTDATEVYSLGKDNLFTASVKLRLGTDGPVSPPYGADIAFTITQAQPEQSFVLDITNYVNLRAFQNQDITKITTAIVPGSYSSSPASFAPNMRLSLVLEETYLYDRQPLTLAALAPDPGHLEQTLNWTADCFTENYQLQVLKLTAANVSGVDPVSEATWQQRAGLLEVQTTSQSWQTTFAEGYGTYWCRMRAIANIAGDGETSNPENWGNWSNTMSFTLAAGGGIDLDARNWIYSRTFTEGGRVAEKLTFANGLLQAGQTLARQATTQRIVALQTLPDYTGRTALQSLPIPLASDAYLTFKPSLLQQVSTGSTPPLAYSADDFDTDDTYRDPAKAKEQNYYTATPVPNATAPINAGVADAEEYPFARTLFRADGTSRVAEQGQAGKRLGLHAADSHTTRITYATVAQDELTRLMGREAPLASKTMKTLTTDPNGVVSVSYQTLDGKTIATALSGPTGANLKPLSSSNAATTISDQLLDASDYNGIGSVSRKNLELTEPTDVTFNYGLTPQQLQDDCGNVCQSCDYRIDIVYHRVGETQTFPAFDTNPVVVPFTACTSATVPTFAAKTRSLPAGSWVIEKKVTSYNSATTSSSTYLDDQIYLLQTSYSTYQTQGDWAAITGTPTPSNPGFLNTSNKAPTRLKDLYTYLDNKPYPKLNSGGQDYYEVPFGCPVSVNGANTQFKVRIPVVGNCARDCTSSFEGAFASQYPAATVNPLPTFPAGQNKFDLMVNTMLSDATPQGYVGQCDQLYDAWQGQLAAYPSLVSSSASLGTVNLSDGFLTYAWSLLPRRTVTGSGGQPQDIGVVRPFTAVRTVQDLVSQPEHTYHWAGYDQTNDAHLQAMRVALGVAGLSHQDVLRMLPLADSAVANKFYRYSRAASSGSSTPLTSSQAQALTEAQGIALSQQANLVAETRRLEFKNAVLAYAADPAHPFPNVDDCRAELLAEEMVLECQRETTLDPQLDYDYQTNTAGQVTAVVMKPAAIVRLQNVLLGLPQIALYATATAGGTPCAAGMQNAPTVPTYSATGGGECRTTPVYPSQTAKELLHYADALVRAVKQATPGSTLACPDVEGVAHLTPTTFTYAGPLSVASGLYSGPAAETGRSNYWVNLLDVRDATADGQYNFRIAAHTLDAQQAPAPALLSGECLPVGEDAPGVNKLPLTSTYTGSTDYVFSFYVVDPNNPFNTGNRLAKADIASISAPYSDLAKYNYFSGYQYESISTKSVFVLIQKTDGTWVKAGITASGSNPIYWREPRSCYCTTLPYGVCLGWTPDAPIDNSGTHIPTSSGASCQEAASQQLLANIQSQQQQWITERLTAYRARYTQQCAAPSALIDNLSLSYKLGYHHFTLYYYDRGGRLLKTIPPAGVAPLDLTDPAHPAYPSHQLPTTYAYNSLGQLVRQNSPDGGTTNFYYNKAGQLRYSLNDKQRQEGKYSYSAYDALGRPVETGESTFNYSAQLTQPLLDIDVLAVPVTGVSNRVRTTYSTPAAITYPVSPGYGGSGQGQHYLTNRVSYSTASEPNTTSPQQATTTYYSYDPHGNVEWTAQDIAGLNEVKFVRYEYDLIGNKVLKVAYQEGRPDQFFHQYKYDADNRLTAVLTSTDGTVWDQDAQYQYYAHGPLQRVVLGDDQVQGLDYAYTLQGWLKAVNHPNLTATDPISQAAGKDGQSNGVASDAFGMVLGYFRKDYISAGTYLDASVANPAKVLREPDANLELFNGNIATWTSRSLETVPGNTPTIAPVAESYRYDQLNRLLGSERSTFSVSSSSWSASSLPTVADPISAFATRYTYDANGNLQTLKRKSNSASQLLDDLTYNYNQLPNSSTVAPSFGNQLQWVTDQVPNSISTEDVDNQPGTTSTPNYTYDAVGNLQIDDQGGVGKISWTPNGKIARVDRKDGTVVTYNYDAQGNRVSKRYAPSAAPGVDTRTTYYVRDASGKMMAIYERKQPSTSSTSGTLTLVEQPLYGSSRLGERRPGLLLTTGQTLPASTGYYARVLGQKLYELTDHLGNVRAVVTDEKTSTLSASTGQPLLSSLKPVLNAFYNYYPFGQLQPGRYAPANPTATSGYRFGYNGKEKDNNGEQGNLTTYDYGFRIYNPGLGRFLSVDPLTRNYPAWSPYPFAMNRPNDGIDLDGKEWSVSRTVTQEGEYTHTATEFTVKLRVVNNSKIITSSADVIQAANDYKAQVEQSFKYSSTDTDSQEIFTYSTTVVLDFTPLKAGEVPTTSNGFWLCLDDKKSVVTTDALGNTTTSTIMGTSLLGRTKTNLISMGVTADGVKRPVNEFARTGAHESGHTAGLPHPWNTSDIEQRHQYGVNQRPSSSSQPRGDNTTISDNLMNSNANPDATLNSSKGTQLERSQFESMYHLISGK